MQPLKMANNQAWELGVLGLRFCILSCVTEGSHKDSFLQPLHRHLEHEVFG